MFENERNINLSEKCNYYWDYQIPNLRFSGVNF